MIPEKNIEENHSNILENKNDLLAAERGENESSTILLLSPHRIMR